MNQVSILLIIFISFLMTSCTPALRNVALNKPAYASNVYKLDKSPNFAVDGLLETGWIAAGFPVQWIEIDLESIYRIQKIELVIDQNPAGFTEHKIYGRKLESQKWSLISTIKGYTSGGQSLLIKGGKDMPYKQVRFIRVVTEKSPSWVAWLEIKIFAYE